MATYVDKAVQLINDQIEWTEKQLLAKQDDSEPPPENIRWSGTRMEFVELIYALHTAGCFGKTTLKKAFLLIGKLFDYETPNHYRLFWDIRNRVTKERTFFLNKMREKLSERLIRMDA